MSITKKGKITIVNIISILGLALLGFFTFMGAMFFSSGSTGTSVAIALGSVIVTALILSGAVYCKGVENHFDKWKKIEISLVIVFWIFAILPVRYVIHFFEVIAEKEELLKAADADINAINRLFNDYEAYERSAMGVTLAGLENALGQPSDDATGTYFKDAAIRSTDDIRSWMATQRGILTGSRGIDGFSYTRFHENVDSVAGAWHNSIKSWDVMFIAVHAGDLVEIVPQIASSLSENSMRAKLPVIEFSDGIYTMSCPAQFRIFDAPSLLFGKNVNEFSGTNPIYYVIYLLIMGMIFLNYLLGYRSSKTDITANNSDPTLAGGNIL